ncbi:MAG TPA: hypothetical protein VIC28_16535 [Thermoanaerobaculia bacterium]
MTRSESGLEKLSKLVKEVTRTLEEEDSPERWRKLEALEEKIRKERSQLLRDIPSEHGGVS